MTTQAQENVATPCIANDECLPAIFRRTTRLQADSEHASVNREGKPGDKVMGPPIQRPERFTRLDGPDSQRIAPASAGCVFAVCAYDTNRTEELGWRLQGPDFLRTQIAHLKTLSRTGNDSQTGAGRKAGGIALLARRYQYRALGAAGRIPDSDSVVEPAGGQRAAIRAKGDGHDGALMAR